MLLTEIFREQNYVLRLLLKEERVAYLEGDCSRCRSKMWYKKEKKKKSVTYTAAQHKILSIETILSTYTCRSTLLWHLPSRSSTKCLSNTSNWPSIKTKVGQVIGCLSTAWLVLVVDRLKTLVTLWAQPHLLPSLGSSASQQCRCS